MCKRAGLRNRFNLYCTLYWQYMYSRDRCQQQATGQLHCMGLLQAPWGGVRQSESESAHYGRFAQRTCGPTDSDSTTTPYCACPHGVGPTV
jgi:hypothetical protein